MSEITNIEWASSTGNPWIGCTKVSPGCKNCYAATLDANRFSRTMGGGTKQSPVSHWGKGAPRFRTKGFWKDALKWNREAGRYHYSPIRPEREFSAFGWRPHKPRIFPSLCDWLDDEVPIEWLADFLKLIHDTPNLDWLLLTKRPENFASRVSSAAYPSRNPEYLYKWASDWVHGIKVPNNIWIGFSAENQEWFDKRWAIACDIPAVVTFCSLEPLLGPIVLPQDFLDLKCWPIFGGESGKGARPCNIDWIRSGVKQCATADVRAFVKQLGSFVTTDEMTPDGWPPGTCLEWNKACVEHGCVFLKHKKGGDPLEWPADLRVREFPTV
jgi:protein gp37